MLALIKPVPRRTFTMFPGTHTTQNFSDAGKWINIEVLSKKSAAITNKYVSSEAASNPSLSSKPASKG